MTDEQNKQNQAGVTPATDGASGGSPLPPAAVPVISPVTSSAGTVSASNPPKKRRRRRKRKPAAPSGQDVPLVLSSEKAGLADAPATRDVSTKELASTPPSESLKDIKVPEITYEPPPPLPEPVTNTFSEPVPEPPPPAPTYEPVPAESLSEPSPEVPPVSEPYPQAELDQSQKVFEEGVIAEPEENEVSETSETAEPEVLEAEVVEPEKPEEPGETPEDEKAKRQASLDEAKKLSESLAKEEPVVLDELPSKQGILGKFFNFLERLVHGRDVEKFLAKEQAAAAKLKIEEQPKVFETETVAVQGPGLISKILKLLIKLVILAALVLGAFWVGSSLKVMDHVNRWFNTAPSGLELVQGDNAKVVQDLEMVRKWGFQTAVYFGKNGGDIRDVAYNVFFNAGYFGRLRDPIFYGETGISAAIYYGFGKESEYVKNRFIYYINYLAKIRYANQVRVQDVMKGKTDRDQALENYLKDARVIFTEGNRLRKEINTQVDDLKISVNSINPDKDRFETDFFASLGETEAEKAETLLGKFVEVTQKQTELKAKLAAMSKLAEYYEEDLITMKIRLDAIEKNKQALVSGVTVVETPGVDLNLVR